MKAFNLLSFALTLTCCLSAISPVLGQPRTASDARRASDEEVLTRSVADQLSKLSQGKSLDASVQRNLITALKAYPEHALRPYWVYALAQSKTPASQVFQSVSPRDGLRAHFFWWRAMAQPASACAADFARYSRTLKSLPSGIPMPLIPDSQDLQKKLPCLEKLSEAERLPIVKVVQKHRYFWLLPRLLKDVKSPEALFMQGENRLLRRKYPQAAQSFVAVLKHPQASSDLKKRAAIQAGVSEQRRRRTKQANTWFQWISASDRTYYPEVLWHQKQWQTLIQNYPEHPRAPEAMAERLDNAVKAQRFREVESLALRLVRYAPQHKSAHQARYWLARSLQKRGQSEAARSWYQKQSRQALNNYYTQMSLCRLNNENCYALSHPRNRQSLTRKTPQLPFLKREPLIQKLIAQRQTQVLQIISPFVAIDDAERDLLTAYAYRYNGHYFRSIRTIWKQQTRNAEVLRLMYPLHYDALQKENAKRYNIPQALIAGITWQESMYKSDIRSPSGARGLMQLMPRTARYISKRAGLPGLSISQLNDPKINIRLGSYYLQQQVKPTGGNIAYIAASYNGGPNAVKKWRRQFGNIDTDVFIERIPYVETRRYAKQVTMHTRIYNAMYGVMYRN